MVVAVAAASFALSAGAPDAQAHVLTAGTATAIAERYSHQVADRAEWAEEWSFECSRETPYTYSCNAQLWNSGPGSRFCWQWFNVVQPNFGIWGRPRIEEIEPWECEENAA
jgi:hypothetical protein